MKKAKIFAFIILLSLLISPILANSLELVGWTKNGIRISNGIGWHQNPQICSDGEGGAIIVWESSVYSQTDIYTQRIDSNGTIQWTLNSIEICTASGDQENLQICGDSEGGAIIAWEDKRNSSITKIDIYTQRIDSNGTIQWMENGIEICTAMNDQNYLQICSDGAGGAIITWQDLRKVSDFDIYAQRIDKNGNILWWPNGTEICTAINDQNCPQICSDGEGGAIIAWQDERNDSNPDIYVQRINSSGNIQWDSNGTAICTINGWQALPRIVSDELGGAFLTWMDNRSINGFDIYAQKINLTGNIQWNKNGTAICTAIDTQLLPHMISDGVGGAIITWLDYRDFGTSIFAQRINSNGNIQWIEDGVPICMYYVFFYYHICSDGEGGAIITWDDLRNDDTYLDFFESNIDIYAQKINTYGVIQWTKNGLPVSTKYGAQTNPQLVSDGAGGAIITWMEGSSIYTQRTIISNEPDTFFIYIMLSLLISLIFITTILSIFALISKLRLFEPLKRVFTLL